MKPSAFKLLFSLAIMLIFTAQSYSQADQNSKPKLVVGIVVDQMKYEYLYKYENKYGEGGFKRLIKEGFNFKNAQYNYSPTVTAAGHASIYSGTTPSKHGIIDNTWYDRNRKTVVDNVRTEGITIVGSVLENSWGVSPVNLKTTTFTDELRVSNNYKSKVIGISLKDRGAILPGGHKANAAYWHDWETSPGHFVSSSYYLDSLPNWVVNFNSLGKSDTYLSKEWNTLYDIEQYTESAPDYNNSETRLGGKRTPTFPYNLPELKERYKSSGSEYRLIWVSPAGNSLLTDFAIELMENEKMGTDDYTDVLSISYTVTDVAGHTFGSHSVELQDIFLRLDREIERLLNYLDENFGKGNYLLFLTSDHGALAPPSYLEQQNIPTGVARINQYKNALELHLDTTVGQNDWIEHFVNEQVYLNRDIIEQQTVPLSEIQQKAAQFLRRQEDIIGALTADEMQSGIYKDALKNRVQNGYYPERSGDLILTFKPGTIIHTDSEIPVALTRGSYHSTGYAYDTHVPLLFFGNSITPGESVRKVAPVDIASSISAFLNIALPSGSSGTPLIELFK